MMPADSTYVTFTPYGRVDAVFGDEPGVALRGSDDAVAHVLRTMQGVTGSGGMCLTVDSVDEHDYFHFCQPEESQVRILLPAGVVLDEAERDGDGGDGDDDDEGDDFDPQAEFDSCDDEPSEKGGAA